MSRNGWVVWSLIKMEFVTLVIICGLLLPFVGMEKLLFAAMTLMGRSVLAYTIGTLWVKFGNPPIFKVSEKDT